MNRTRMIAVGSVAALTLVVLAAAITWWLKPGPSTVTASAPPAAPTVTVTPFTNPSTPAGSQTTPGESAPAETTPDSVPVESVPAYPSGEPASKTAAAQRRWMPVAVAFAKRFTDVPSEKSGKSGGTGLSAKTRWRAALRPYITADLARQLATVDLRNVPDGHYADAEAVDWGEDQVVVQVDYDAGDAGWSLVLDISTQDAGKTWQVNRYDRQDLG